MLIPSPLRKVVLEGLHSAHQGINGMLSNARERFFWPGLDSAIRLTRTQCRQCNENAPSQPKESPTISPPPEMPFEQVAMDFCHISGHTYLVYADRYSGWVEIARLSSTAFPTVKRTLLELFRTFGVPVEIATDGGPPFNGFEYLTFLKDWLIRKRLSSAYYPQSNGRAEAAVKSAKRILLGNTNPVTGQLDTYEATRALMNHRNTPQQDTNLSPAVTLFGRPLRDHLPSRNRQYRQEWIKIADKKEEALAKHHIYANATDRELKPLNTGDSVQIQNQTGNHPTRWYNTGTVSEALPNRQYQVIVDGSRRVTLRNRRFLRKIDPVCRKTNTEFPQPPLPPLTHHEQPAQEEAIVNPPLPLIQTDLHAPRTTVDETKEQPTPQPRRSERARRPRRPLSPKLTGQSHD